MRSFEGVAEVLVSFAFRQDALHAPTKSPNRHRGITVVVAGEFAEIVVYAVERALRQFESISFAKLGAKEEMGK